MGLLNGLLQQAEGAGFSAIAQKLGLPEDRVASIGESVIAKMQAGSSAEQAAAETAAETGVDPSQVQAVVPAIAEHVGADGTGGLMEKLNTMAGEGGVMGAISGFLDRDGDGNPINDVVGMAQGFFAKK